MTDERHDARALLRLGTANGVEGLRDRRSRVHRCARAGRPRDDRALLARDRHRRRRGAGQDAARLAEARRRDVSARHAACSAPDPTRRHRAAHRARDDSRAHRRQRRRSVCRRCVDDARRRGVHDLSVPRRVRGARRREAIARERAGLSAAARDGPWARRALRAHRPAAACGSVRRSGIRIAEGRLRERPAAGRRVRSSRRGALLPTASRSPICGCPAAASAPSSIRRASRSPIS